ncbi:hypothetical protein MANES_03G145466v8 [Manihot esculenta]|uniref:Uncharacterized protein n=1 Tax=Manihot esculenta TaxID=3983 RepID=A0ACB7I5R2_MANES|nr:hypothetical protein MANES_03G145466v8 [Manihot esculenta]
MASYLFYHKKEGSISEIAKSDSQELTSGFGRTKNWKRLARSHNSQSSSVAIREINPAIELPLPLPQKRVVVSSLHPLSPSPSQFSQEHTTFTSTSVEFKKPRFGDANIWERLDRSLASYNWISLYQHANLSHLDDLGSNHRPFLLNLYPSTSKAKRFFWFDSRWTSKSEAFAIISEAWNANGTASSLFNVFSKLKACKHALVSWDKLQNSNSRIWIIQLQDMISRCKNSSPSCDFDRLHFLESELASEVRREEQF